MSYNQQAAPARCAWAVAETCSQHELRRKTSRVPPGATCRLGVPCQDRMRDGTGTAQRDLTRTLHLRCSLLRSAPMRLCKCGANVKWAERCEGRTGVASVAAALAWPGRSVPIPVASCRWPYSTSSFSDVSGQSATNQALACLAWTRMIAVVCAFKRCRTGLLLLGFSCLVLRFCCGMPAAGAYKLHASCTGYRSTLILLAGAGVARGASCCKQTGICWHAWPRGVALFTPKQ